VHIIFSSRALKTTRKTAFIASRTATSAHRILFCLFYAYALPSHSHGHSMNRSLRVVQAVGLRPSARRVTLLAFHRPPPTTLPKLRTRARFLADGPAAKTGAGKQRLSTHALSSEAAEAAASGSAHAAEDPVAREKTLTGRLKALIRTYGWYAFGLYTVIGFVDFSISFAAIQVVGREKVADATHWLKEKTMVLIGDWWPQKAHDESVEHAVDVVSGSKSGAAAIKGLDAGLWASIVLAYGIHKTLFLPVRVGITAAVTPGFVKWLQSRGWAGVQGTKRAAEAARASMRHKPC